MSKDIDERRGATRNGDEPMDYSDDPGVSEYRRVQERQILMYGIEHVERARQVAGLYVKHKKFVEALAALDRVYQLARQFQSVPVGLRLIGPSGTGKTSVINYFRQSLPGSDLVEAGMGAIMLRLRKGMAPSYFVEQLLKTLRYPLPRSSPRDYANKFDIALSAMERKGTRVLIIDEAHYLMDAPAKTNGKSGEGTTISNLLSESIDDRIALVLAGGVGLKNLGNHDEFLASRCMATHSLESFSISEGWAQLLANFNLLCTEHSLAILREPAQCEPIFAATQGSLRKLKALLAEAIMVSSHAGRKSVTVDDLRLAFVRALDQPDGVNPWKTA